MTAPGGPGRHGRDDEHTRWEELAVGWALHALEPEDEAQFTAHLPGCQRCARTVADTTEVMAAMAEDLPQAEPSDGLRHRLRAAVEETEQVRPAESPAASSAARPSVPAVPPDGARHTGASIAPVPPAAGSRFGNLRAPLPPRDGDPRPAWRRVLPTALVAAAVAAILSLGAWNVVVTSDRDAAEATAAEQSRMLETLLAPGRATIAPLTERSEQVATVVARDDEVTVLTTGLPVNDRDDSTYVVWGMSNGVPEALGTFDVVTPAMDLRNVVSTETGLDQYDGYAISAEPGREAPSFPTDVVASGQVDS